MNLQVPFCLFSFWIPVWYPYDLVATAEPSKPHTQTPEIIAKVDPLICDPVLRKGVFSECPYGM